VPEETGTAITFRRFRDGDEHAINAGFERAFSTRRELAEWYWKFPVAERGRTIIVATGEDGTLLAHFAGIREHLQVDGREYRVAQNVDVYALREARRSLAGSSVYLETARAFFREYLTPDDLAMVYGFPGPRNEPLTTRYLGYEPVRAVMVWERAVRRRLASWTGHRVGIGCDLAAAEEAWRRAAPRYPVALRRDAARLARRFAGRPGITYLQLTAWRRSVPSAVAVLRIDGGEASWADLVWDGADARAVVAIDQAAGRLAQAAGARSLKAWLAGDGECEEVLRCRGWTCSPHPAGLKLVARSGGGELRTAQLVDRIYLTMADADLV
jgi:hypothetical protein